MIDGKIQQGTIVRQCRKLRFIALRHLTFFILKNKMIRTDDDPRLSDRRRNAMSHNIFHFGMHFLMIQMLFNGSIDDSLCHGMRKMFFQTCRDTKQFVTISLRVKRNDIRHARLRLGQCTCLVKYDRIRLCHCL